MKITRRKIIGGSLAAAPLAAATAALFGEGEAAAQAGLSAEGLAEGGEIRLPRGYTRLAEPFRFAGNRLNIRGDGPYASTVQFEPEAPGAAAIELDTPGRGGQAQSSIAGLGFHSTNSVDKTAIRLPNVANVNIERIGIAGRAWPGAGSIGIHTAGRQFVRIRDCDLVCARPIVMSANPAWPTIGADFFQISSCELATSLPRGACVEVEDGVVAYNLSVRDTCMARGADGFRFVDRSSRGASCNLEFQNCRTEQGESPSGWSYDLRSARQSFQSILFQNVRCDGARNGIRISGGHRITLINVDLDQRDGRVALDIEFNPATVLTIIGGFSQVGGTMRLARARKVSGLDSQVRGGAFGPNEIWVYDPTA